MQNTHFIQCNQIQFNPLLYSPGKRGFYSPVQGRATPERLNAFRNVGRLMGLCLLQNELCPLFFNRHVIKHLLSRKVRFHDLAFFDPVIYESLRQLVVDAENKVIQEYFLLKKPNTVNSIFNLKPKICSFLFRKPRHNYLRL